MNTREELRRTAAEYVLGTLDGSERAAFKDWMAQDAEVAALVRMWERRFAPLLELSAPARVPSTLLDDILSKLPLDLPAKPPVSEAEEAPAQEAEPDPSATSAPDMPALPGGADGEEVAPPLAPADVTPAATGPDASPVSPTQEQEPAPSASSETSVPHTPPTETATADAGQEPSGVPPAPDGVSGDAPAPPQLEPVAPEELPSLVPSAPAPAENEAPGQGADLGTILADTPPSTSSAAYPSGKGWRSLSALLFVLLVLGAGAFAYREMQRSDPTPPPVPAPAVVALAPAPFPEPPAAPPPAEEVADAFAVLGPQPAPAIGLTLDVDSGTVSILKLPAPPGEGMRYDLWVLTQQDGPRRLASFRETGDVESLAVRDLDKTRLGDTFLIITEEPEAQAGPVPTGAPVYSGMAVAR